jgi:diguanylate cyclase (GGDEF)-like protein
MAREDKLSAVLSEFARTMATEFPIQGILEHLVRRIVEVLPITAAGVTLISTGESPRYVAASDESALRFERLQTDMGEGPCLSAFDSGSAIAIPDLAREVRYPRFGPAAADAGLAGVFTFPMRHGHGRLGALDLYRDSTGALNHRDMGVAQTLADVAAAYLLNARARDDAQATADRFHHIALHDPLTELPNRLLLQQRLAHAALRSRRSNTNAAILFADLDRFKQVNDSYGHLVGDELLIAVAQRLTHLVRPGDTLARVSGDEFVFLCEDLRSPDDVENLARRIDRAFCAPFVLNDTEISITASVGMAYAGPGEEVSDELIERADVAMYQAKRKGGASHQIIDLREARQTDDRNTLERDLRRAFAEEQLEVAYQPIVRSRDGLITGVEALLRWEHRDLGQVPPPVIVEIAEETGLIYDIGAWVLERSCRDRGRWLEVHPHAPLDVAVNVSVRQLMGSDLEAVVTQALTRTGMDPAHLVLEMTENVFIEDSERAKTILTHLDAFGVRIALDDFGTGYSSLCSLRDLPVHIVKIDQGFIADIGTAPRAAAIVAAVTNLAHVLGLTVTAEGVETEVQRDEVRAIGCESAQGYFYARPMPAAAISDHLGATITEPPYLPVPAVATV